MGRFGHAENGNNPDEFCSKHRLSRFFCCDEHSASRKVSSGNMKRVNCCDAVFHRLLPADFEYLIEISVA